jgi:predicted nucleic acid-binding protein
LSEAEIDAILMDIARHAIVLTPVKAVTTPVSPDRGDQFLWDLLATRADLVLVTGDKLLLQDEVMQQRVILPQTFLAHLQH